MTVYLLNLFFVTLSSCFMLKSLKFSRIENVSFDDKKSLVFIIFITLSLGLVSGLRWRVGTDYWTYERIFYYSKFYSLEKLFQSPLEIIVRFLNYTISNIIHSPKVLFLFYSMLNSFLFVKALKKYSPIFSISLYLYITSMEYYVSFNIIFQYIAVGISFLYGYKYLVKKDFKKYLLIVIIASQFHSSALILIGLYPFLIKAFKSKSKALLIGIFILSYIFFDSFLEILFFFLPGLYREYGDWFGNFGTEVNILRVIVALSPLLYTSFYYKKVRRSYRDIDILMNMSLVNSLFVFLAMRNSIFMRPGFYFNIYNTLLIAKVLKEQEKKYLIAFVLMLCYLAYMVIVLPYDADLLPYKTIFKYYFKF